MITPLLHSSRTQKTYRGWICTTTPIFPKRKCSIKTDLDGKNKHIAKKIKKIPKKINDVDSDRLLCLAKKNHNSSFFTHNRPDG